MIVIAVASGIVKTIQDVDAVLDCMQLLVKAAPDQPVVLSQGYKRHLA